LILSCRADRAKSGDDHNEIELDDDGERKEVCTGISPRDGDRLAPVAELAAEGFFECRGCAADHLELSDVLAHCGSLAFYDRAMAAFQLSQMVEKYGVKIKTLDALALEEMMIVEAERARYETREMINASKEK